MAGERTDATSLRPEGRREIRDLDLRAAEGDRQNSIKYVRPRMLNIACPQRHSKRLFGPSRLLLILELKGQDKFEYEITYINHRDSVCSVFNWMHVQEILRSGLDW
jgi:hypothetical protein